MAIKKTELYSSLWASCDELRGGMDASEYKDHVLTMLFFKYAPDMGEENQTVQRRLRKTRQIKRGMMPELLNWRTRLV